MQPLQGGFLFVAAVDVVGDGGSGVVVGSGGGVVVATCYH